MTAIYCGYEMDSNKESIVTLSKSPFEWALLADSESTKYQNRNKKTHYEVSFFKEIFLDNEPESAPVLLLPKIGSPNSDSTIED